MLYQNSFQIQKFVRYLVMFYVTMKFHNDVHNIVDTDSNKIVEYILDCITAVISFLLNIYPSF